MAITPVSFDAAGAGITNANHGTTPQTSAHAVSSSATCVMVGMSVVGSGAAAWASHAPTAITFGGVPMVFHSVQGANNVTNALGFSAVYYLMSPPTGPSVTLSITGTTVGGTYWANSVSYIGVQAVGSPDPVFGSSAAPATDFVYSSPNALLFGMIGCLNVAVSAPTGTGTVNSRYTQSGTSSIFSGFLMDSKPTASNTAQCTCTALTSVWASHCIQLVPFNQVSFDVRGYFVSNTSYGTTPVPQAYVTPIASGCALIVGIGMLGTSAAPWSSFAPTTITYGGQALNLIGQLGNNNVANASGFVALYGLLNPTSRGSQTLTTTAGASATFYWAGACTLLGVASIGAALTNSGSSTNPTTGAIHTAVGHVVMSQLGIFDVVPSYVAPSGGTGFNPNAVSATVSCESGLLDGAFATSASVTQTMTATTAAWATVAVDVAPLLTGPSLFFPFL